MKATEASKDVIKGLQTAAREAKASGKARGAILLVFDNKNIVEQTILGELSVFKTIGAIELLKNDLVNQADQLEQGEI